MDDFLDSGVTTSPVQVEDLVQSQPLPVSPPPQAATGNQAAITSMISNPFKQQDNYNAIVSEAQQGQTTTRELLNSAAQSSMKEQDTGSLMSMLADTTVPHAQKRMAIDSFQQNFAKYDTSSILQNNLVSKPVDGETVDAEQARLSIVDDLAKGDASRAGIQVMANALKQQADNDSPFTKFINNAAGLIPFRNAIVQDETYRAVSQATGIPRNVLDTFQSYWANGTQTAKMRAYVQSLPPDQQLAFAKIMYQSVQNNSGFLYGNDNHQKAFEEFSKVFSQDGYGLGSQFLDNFAGLADLAGASATLKDIGIVGQQVARSIKGGSGLLNANEAAQFASQNAGKAIPSTVREEPTLNVLVTGNARQTGAAAADQAQAGGISAAANNTPIPANLATPMVPNPSVTALQQEREGLLGVAGQAAQKGDNSIADALSQARSQVLPDVGELTKQNQSQGMKFKDAQKAAQKSYDDALSDQQATIGRLTEQQNAQAEGSRAANRIGEIDKQISTMPSHVPATKTAISESVSQAMTRLGQQSAVHQINPNSPMEIAQNANPQAARQLHQAIVTGDDEIAHALTGNDPQQAIADAVLPQVSDTGTVFSRTADIDRSLRQANQDPELVNLLDNTSVNAFSPAEAAKARAAVVHDFQNANGLSANDAMSNISFAGNRARVSQVYESEGGSFSKAEDAVEQAKYALRQYGITDDNITVLRKNGVNHEPVDLDAVRGVPGDYKIRVDSNFELNPHGINTPEGQFWDTFDVKRNYFDRFAGTQFKDRGSVQRYVVDAASMLHKTITGSAVVAKDYGARFERVMMNKAESFGKAMKEFPAGRQAAIDDYIREANFKGIAFDKADLAARGFNAREVGAISQWRDFWDAHYYLENLDNVRSLRNQGYELFENPNARLFAKPIGRATNVSTFYDPALDAVRSFAPGELDALYNQGGTIARLRRPASMGGTTVEHMIVRQNANEYTRVLNDGDRILNKREGYYTITYKAPKFVDELDSTGKKVRTVAVAGDTNEANQFVRRMQSNAPGTLYRVRNDTRGYRFDSDEVWDTNAASGRIAQRHRGQLLEDGSGLNHLGDMGYIEHPALSAERAAKSISGRTVMRNVIDTGVERAINQYGHLFPKDMYGNVRWPQSAKEIGEYGLPHTSEAADARTTWEYLNWLRQGYINSMNDGYKAVLNQIADAASGKPTAERFFRNAANADVANLGRKTTFTMYLATNPLRQMLTQGMQAWRISQYNPTGMLSGRIPKLMMEFYGEHSLGQKATDFTKFMDESGMVEAVKHHNLSASVLNTLADEGNTVTRAVNNSVGFLRRVGFDTGELANMVAHSAAVFDRYKGLGRDIKDRDVVQAMHSEIRALTYDMNAAGDMPYNQGSAATLLQFMQMSHKALLQFANRRLDPATRVRMGIGDAVLWGVGIDKLADAFGYDILPGDDTIGKKLLKDGAVALLYNHMLNTISPGTKDMDFSSFSPYGLDGWAKMFHAATTGGLLDLVNSSPTAGLITNRFADVFKQMSSVFAPQPYDNRNTPEKFLDTVNSVAKLSSGWSNAEKAYLMMKAGEQRDKYGMLIDGATTSGDALAQMFGFTSKKEADSYALSKTLSDNAKANKQDVLNHYNDIKKFYADQYAGGNTPDLKRMTDIAGAAMMIYDKDPEALRIIQQQFGYDMSGKDQMLAKQMMKSMNLPGMTDYHTQIDQGPWDDNTKAQMKQMLEYAKNAQQQLTDMEGK